jgi:hypothetical protein
MPPTPQSAWLTHFSWVEAAEEVELTDEERHFGASVWALEVVMRVGELVVWSLLTSPVQAIEIESKTKPRKKDAAVNNTSIYGLMLSFGGKALSLL